MNSFKEFLLEVTMRDAIRTFQLKSNFTANDVKAKYRQLSKENHPDRGGSTEAMKDINVAYDLLKTISVNTSTKEEDDYSSENFKKMWNDTAIHVIRDLVKNLDIDTYKTYFETTFNEQFNVKINKVYPDDQDIANVGTGFRFKTFYDSSYNIKFSNNNNTKVFELNIFVNIADVVKQANRKGLSSSKTTYPMSIITFAYMDSRRVKITSRDYTYANRKSIFTKPDTIFPKSKINKKKKKTLFRKASMLASLKAELQADVSGDFYFLKTGDGNKYIAVYRNVFMRTAMWNIHSIQEKNERGRYINTKQNIKHLSLPESEDTLDIFRKLMSLSIKDGLKLIEVEYNKLINA